MSIDRLTRTALRQCIAHGWQRIHIACSINASIWAYVSPESCHLRCCCRPRSPRVVTVYAPSVYAQLIHGAALAVCSAARAPQNNQLPLNESSADQLLLTREPPRVLAPMRRPHPSAASTYPPMPEACTTIAILNYYPVRSSSYMYAAVAGTVWRPTGHGRSIDRPAQLSRPPA